MVCTSFMFAQAYTLLGMAIVSVSPEVAHAYSNILHFSQQAIPINWILTLAVQYMLFQSKWKVSNHIIYCIWDISIPFWSYNCKYKFSNIKITFKEKHNFIPTALTHAENSYLFSGWKKPKNKSQFKIFFFSIFLSGKGLFRVLLLWFNFVQVCLSPFRIR